MKTKPIESAASPAELISRRITELGDFREADNLDEAALKDLIRAAVAANISGTKKRLWLVANGFDNVVRALLALKRQNSRQFVTVRK